MGLQNTQDNAGTQAPKNYNRFRNNDYYEIE
jgi:hypothetical protein